MDTTNMVKNSNLIKNNNNNNKLIYFNGFSHNDFSDASLFGPQWLLRKIKMNVKNQTNKNAQDLFCKVCIEFILNLINDNKWKSIINGTKYLKYDKKYVEIL